MMGIAASASRWPGLFHGQVARRRSCHCSALRFVHSEVQALGVASPAAAGRWRWPYARVVDRVPGSNPAGFARSRAGGRWRSTRGRRVPVVWSRPAQPATAPRRGRGARCRRRTACAIAARRRQRRSTHSGLTLRPIAGHQQASCGRGPGRSRPRRSRRDRRLATIRCRPCRRVSPKASRCEARPDSRGTRRRRSRSRRRRRCALRACGRAPAGAARSSARQFSVCTDAPSDRP